MNKEKISFRKYTTVPSWGKTEERCIRMGRQIQSIRSSSAIAGFEEEGGHEPENEVASRS